MMAGMMGNEVEEEWGDEDSGSDGEGEVVQPGMLQNLMNQFGFWQG